MWLHLSIILLLFVSYVWPHFSASFDAIGGYVREDEPHLLPEGKALRAQSAGEILVTRSEGTVLLPNPDVYFCFGRGLKLQEITPFL